MHRSKQFARGELAAGAVAPEAGSASLSFAGYMAWGGAVVAAGVALVVAGVVFVDPYGLFGFAQVDGINRIKPRPEHYLQEIKLAQVRALQPTVLLLGNSRTEIGFDPDSPLLGARGESAYNLALAGTRLAVSQHMHEAVRETIPPPTRVIVGVEFLDFLVDGVAPLRASPATHGFEAMPWQWRFDTVFSLSAVFDAIAALRIQDLSHPPMMTRRGHNPLLEYHGFARKEGYFSIFQQRAQENAKNLLGRPRGLSLAGGADSDSTLRLRAMLERMAQDGTEVDLVIYPYHAQLMAMFTEVGLHGAMDDWKRLLVREAERARGRHQGARIAVWDFSGYGPMQCERIPAAGDLRGTTRWYWEGGHFKSTLGELMLDRMLGGAQPIGFALTSSTLAQNTQRVAAERAHCARVYPTLFDETRTLVAKARSARTPN